MKGILVAVLSLLVVTQAQAAKPCEELKVEIAARLDAKGVVNYVLEIVPAEEATDKRIVGTCDGGSRKITYTRE